jgi:uncharacterized protein (DUF1330 family)
MPAYAIFIRDSTRDPKELETYSKVAPATLSEFPTFEAAKAWYDSPAYREAREHRFKGANYRAFIVQGV